MKRLILAAAALAVPLFATASQAASISFNGLEGQLFMKYRNLDVGKLYNTTPADTTGEANVDALQVSPNPNTVPLPGSANPREDAWGIAIVDEIRIGGAFGTLVYSASNPALQGNTQVAAIFYGTHDIEVVNNPNGTQTIESNNVFVDFYASLLGNNADGVDLTSLDATHRMNDINNTPSYTGITDGTHIFSFVSHQGSIGSNPQSSFETTIDPNLTPNSQTGVIGGGNLFLDVGTTPLGTGTQNGSLKVDPLGPGSADALVSFTTLSPPPGSSGFNVGSNDPLLAQALAPAPKSVWAGAAVMGGLGLAALRRRKLAM